MGIDREHEKLIGQFDFTKPADHAKLEPVHFGHLPVWAEGNVYLNGAKASRHDKNALILGPDEEVYVEFALEGENTGIKTDIYDRILEHVSDLHCRLITSDILGKAFEQDQRFEAPDGSEI